MKQAVCPNRTQISLSDDIKALIESRAFMRGESLSEYLRKAAVVRMALEDVDKADLALIADAVIGKIQKGNSGWKHVSDIGAWQKKEREYEDKHRT